MCVFLILKSFEHSLKIAILEEMEVLRNYRKTSLPAEGNFLRILFSNPLPSL